MAQKAITNDEATKEFIETPEFKANSAIYAGGLYSSVLDLSKFISFQFSNTGETSGILSESNKAMMYNFRIGWKQAYPFVLHEGANLGFRVIVVINPNTKFGWVILTNTTDFEFNRINNYFSDLLTPIFTKQPSANSNNNDDYTGTYKLKGGYGQLTIYEKDGKLFSTYLEKDLPNSFLIPLDANKYRAQGKGNYNIDYEFIPGENGQIKYLSMGQLMWEKE
jgi:CubicO group peptidase (beta-lactamase class C family)